MNIDKNAVGFIDDAQLLADEAKYSSFGDTVHYVDPPKIFRHGEGSYMYDTAGVPFLDLQMWYSAVNFGYGNKRLNDALKRQIDVLPQVASQYLHQNDGIIGWSGCLCQHEFDFCRFNGMSPNVTNCILRETALQSRKCHDE